jgi:LysM repeat protein
MAEGGQLPWKRQTIDYSRGPPCDYSELTKPLPKPPNGVKWKQDDETKEWRLIRADDDDKDRRKYSLKVGVSWNERRGRAEPTLVPVPKAKEKPVSLQDADDREDAKVCYQDDANVSYDAERKPTEKVAVENVDYLTHTVLPNDTLVGLCLRYRTKATVLRQLNKFSGSNLHLAPSKLIIPLGPDGQNLLNAGKILAQDQTTPDYKLQSFLAEFPHLTQSERRAYLEMSDWDLDEAMKCAREDELWERDEKKREEETSSFSPRLSPPMPRTILNVHVAIPAAIVDGDIGKGRIAPLLTRELELVGKLKSPPTRVELKDDLVLSVDVDGGDDARVTNVNNRLSTARRATKMPEDGGDHDENGLMEPLLVKELEMPQRCLC